MKAKFINKNLNKPINHLKHFKNLIIKYSHIHSCYTIYKIYNNSQLTAIPPYIDYYTHESAIAKINDDLQEIKILWNANFLDKEKIQEYADYIGYKIK